MTWGVFLDRDGVLNEEGGVVARPEDLRLLPGALDAVRRLREAGAVLAVVTNQPLVARGLVKEEVLREIHRRMEAEFAAHGAPLDAVYYCPHHPETHHPEAADPKYRRDCGCRKPKTGMLEQAAKRFGVAPADWFLVGDSTRDIQAARTFGCRCVLVRTGHGGRDGLYPAQPDAVRADVAEAAAWILAERGRA